MIFEVDDLFPTQSILWTISWWPIGMNLRKMILLTTSCKKYSTASPWHWEVSSSHQHEKYLITLSRLVTDLSSPWVGLQGFLQAASLIHFCSQYFFLFLLLTLVLLLFIFTAMPEAMSICQNCNTSMLLFHFDYLSRQAPYLPDNNNFIALFQVLQSLLSQILQNEKFYLIR